MTHLVMGLGEVGSPLAEILGAVGYDPPRGAVALPPRVEVLHVCIPWSETFLVSVRALIADTRPGLVIVHSTVPIGTTAQLPGAVHSPVLGRVPTMRSDLLRIPKWVGGARSAEAAAILRERGFTCRTAETTEQTEALKLLCLAEYGAALAMDRYRRHVAAAVDLPEAMLLEWDSLYNEHTEPALRRRLPRPGGDQIGGHCVIPGARLLSEQYPHPLLDGILRYGPPGPAPTARIHPTAIVREGVTLGKDVAVWAYATIHDGVVLGDHVNVGELTYIGRGTKIGARTRIGAQVHVTDHMEIGENCFIAPMAIFCNDRHPQANNPHYTRESPIVEDNVSIGVNATINPGVRLGRGCVVGAGAMVVKDVAPYTTVVGNPARVLERARQEV